VGFGDLYYKIEDKWYDLLDWIEAKGVPVYSVVDPIEDAGIPSLPVFVGIFLLLCYFVLTAFAPGLGIAEEVNFSVQVSDSNGNLIPDAVVKISKGGELLVEGKTSILGNFDASLPKGSYDISVSAADCDGISKPIEVVESGQVISITLNCEMSFAKQVSICFVSNDGDTLDTPIEANEVDEYGNFIDNAGRCDNADSCNFELKDKSLYVFESLHYRSEMVYTKKDVERISERKNCITLERKEEEIVEKGLFTVELLHSDGSPVPWQLVNLVSPDNHNYIIASQHTSNAGKDIGSTTFKLRVGTKFIIVVPGGENTTYYKGNTTYEISSEPQRVSIKLDTSADTLFAVREEKAGVPTPVQGVKITVFKIKEPKDEIVAFGETDRNGEAHLSLTDGERYRVSFFKAGYRYVETTVKGGSEKEVVLEKISKEEVGTVDVYVSIEGREPVKDAIVIMKHYGNSSKTGYGILKTDARGHVHYEWVLPGEYCIIVARAKDETKCGEHSFTVKANEKTRVNVELKPIMYSLDVNVLLKGEGVRDAKVSVKDAYSGEAIASGKTDYTGFVSFPNIAERSKIRVYVEYLHKDLESGRTTLYSQSTANIIEMDDDKEITLNLVETGTKIQFLGITSKSESWWYDGSKWVQGAPELVAGNVYYAVFAVGLPKLEGKKWDSVKFLISNPESEDYVALRKAGNLPSYIRDSKAVESSSRLFTVSGNYDDSSDIISISIPIRVRQVFDGRVKYFLNFYAEWWRGKDIVRDPAGKDFKKSPDFYIRGERCFKKGNFGICIKGKKEGGIFYPDDRFHLEKGESANFTIIISNEGSNAFGGKIKLEDPKRTVAFEDITAVLTTPEEQVGLEYGLDNAAASISIDASQYKKEDVAGLPVGSKITIKTRIKAVFPIQYTDIELKVEGKAEQGLAYISFPISGDADVLLRKKPGAITELASSILFQVRENNSGAPGRAVYFDPSSVSIYGPALNKFCGGILSTSSSNVGFSVDRHGNITVDFNDYCHLSVDPLFDEKQQMFLYVESPIFEGKTFSIPVSPCVLGVSLDKKTVFAGGECNLQLVFDDEKSGLYKDEELTEAASSCIGDRWLVVRKNENCNPVFGEIKEKNVSIEAKESWVAGEWVKANISGEKLEKNVNNEIVSFSYEEIPPDVVGDRDIGDLDKEEVNGAAVLKIKATAKNEVNGDVYVRQDIEMPLVIRDAGNCLTVPERESTVQILPNIVCPINFEIGNFPGIEGGEPVCSKSNSITYIFGRSDKDYCNDLDLNKIESLEVEYNEEEYSESSFVHVSSKSTGLNVSITKGSGENPPRTVKLTVKPKIEGFKTERKVIVNANLDGGGCYDANEIGRVKLHGNTECKITFSAGESSGGEGYIECKDIEEAEDYKTATVEIKKRVDECPDFLISSASIEGDSNWEITETGDKYVKVKYDKGDFRYGDTFEANLNLELELNYENGKELSENIVVPLETGLNLPGWENVYAKAVQPYHFNDDGSVDVSSLDCESNACNLEQAMLWLKEQSNDFTSSPEEGISFNLVHTGATVHDIQAAMEKIESGKNIVVADNVDGSSGDAIVISSDSELGLGENALRINKARSDGEEIIPFLRFSNKGAGEINSRKARYFNYYLPLVADGSSELNTMVDAPEDLKENVKEMLAEMWGLQAEELSWPSVSYSARIVVKSCGVDDNSECCSDYNEKVGSSSTPAVFVLTSGQTVPVTCVVARNEKALSNFIETVSSFLEGSKRMAYNKDKDYLTTQRNFIILKGVEGSSDFFADTNRWQKVNDELKDEIASVLGVDKKKAMLVHMEPEENWENTYVAPDMTIFVCSKGEQCGWDSLEINSLPEFEGAHIWIPEGGMYKYDSSIGSFLLVDDSEKDSWISIGKKLLPYEGNTYIHAIDENNRNTKLCPNSESCVIGIKNINGITKAVVDAKEMTDEELLSYVKKAEGNEYFALHLIPTDEEKDIGKQCRVEDEEVKILDENGNEAQLGYGNVYLVAVEKAETGDSKKAVYLKELTSFETPELGDCYVGAEEMDINQLMDLITENIYGTEDAEPKLQKGELIKIVRINNPYYKKFGYYDPDDKISSFEVYEGDTSVSRLVQGGYYKLSITAPESKERQYKIKLELLKIDTSGLEGKEIGFLGLAKKAIVRYPTYNEGKIAIVKGGECNDAVTEINYCRNDDLVFHKQVEGSVKYKLKEGGPLGGYVIEPKYYCQKNDANLRESFCVESDKIPTPGLDEKEVYKIFECPAPLGYVAHKVGDTHMKDTINQIVTFMFMQGGVFYRPSVAPIPDRQPSCISEKAFDYMDRYNDLLYYARPSFHNYMGEYFSNGYQSSTVSGTHKPYIGKPIKYGDGNQYFACGSLDGYEYSSFVPPYYCCDVGLGLHVTNGHCCPIGFDWNEGKKLCVRTG